jgi:predicted ArsR family transcriptional regulator
MKQVAADVTHDESEYFQAIRDHAPASTKEVADAVGVTRQGADYRLRKLEDDGKVRSKMVGNSLVWMLAETDE